MTDAEAKSLQTAIDALVKVRRIIKGRKFRASRNVKLIGFLDLALRHARRAASSRAPTREASGGRSVCKPLSGRRNQIKQKGSKGEQRIRS